MKSHMTTVSPAAIDAAPKPMPTGGRTTAISRTKAIVTDTSSLLTAALATASPGSSFCGIAINSVLPDQGSRRTA
jgi:hypothetical protein